MSSTVDFLHRLRQFVQSEADAQRQVLDRHWSRPLRERVSKGWAIEGLRVVGFDKNIAQLVCDSNHSRFREGDLVILHRGSPRDPNPELIQSENIQCTESSTWTNHWIFSSTPTLVL
jgi:DNA replication ATP-dependent helicase Dna2